MRKILLFNVSLMLIFVCFGFKACDTNKPPATGGIDPCNVGRPAFSGLCVTDSSADIHQALNGSVGVPKDRSDLKFSFVTPEGARVLSVVEIPQNFKDAIDPALDAVHARYHAHFPNWNFYLKNSDTDLLVITCNETAISPEIFGTPIQSFFGQFAAGATIGTTPQEGIKKMYSVLCQQEFAFVDYPTPRHRVDAGWTYLDFWEAAIMAEEEHKMDRANNIIRFNYYQGVNEQHPQPLDVP